jgi:hypothetical protein
MRRWCTIAPVVSAWRGPSFEFTEPLELGAGVRLVRAPDWLRHHKIMRFLGPIEQQHLDEAQFALLIDYEADALDEPDPEWTRQVGMSKQLVAAEKLTLANLGLWLARPSWLAFKLVLDVWEDTPEWVLRRAYPKAPARPHARDAENTLTLADLALAQALVDSALTLPVGSAPWRSLLMLWRSLAEIAGDERYLFLWIGLEALFGPSDASEITYRLSQRLAFFLSEDRATAAALYRRAKDAYRLRSKIVHGFQIERLAGEKKNALLIDSESWIRAALQKIIGNADLRRTFETDNRREEFLDALVFSET